MKQHIPEITVGTLAVIALTAYISLTVVLADLPKLPCPYETDYTFCTDNSCKGIHKDRASRAWWKIPDRRYFSFSVDNVEWMLVYPDTKSQMYMPKDTRIEVHAKPTVTKMKDGWYKITFESE
jgi:hypothetical protein